MHYHFTEILNCVPFFTYGFYVVLASFLFLCYYPHSFFAKPENHRLRRWARIAFFLWLGLTIYVFVVPIIHKKRA